MRDKNIFFIWLGDNIPSYFDYAIKSFSDRLNKNFKIQKITFKTEQIEKIGLLTSPNKLSLVEKQLWYAIQHVKNNKNEILNCSDNIKFIIKIHEFFKIYIINLFGGMFIDADTYLIKNIEENIFDINDVLLCKRCGYVDKGIIGFRGGFIENIYDLKLNDIFKIILSNSFKQYYFKLLDRFDNENNYILWKNLRSDFFNLNFKLESIKNTIFDSNDNYIMHFNDFSWSYEKTRETRIPYTIFDDKSKMTCSLVLDKYLEINSEIINLELKKLNCNKNDIKYVFLNKNTNLIEKDSFKNFNQLEEIGNLTTIKIIENNAFEGCINLKRIILTQCIKIGNYAFKDCENLTEFYFPQFKKTIADINKIFIGCKNLKKIGFQNNIIKK